jgi:hypothetical protein
MNALENENLGNQGEVNDNVGQDGSGEQNNESSDDWKSQAKYFQSEKDKLYSENQTLKKYEKVGKFLESRPDIVEKIKGDLSNNGEPKAQENRISLEKDEFDPWEAYNDPASKSYKFREQEDSSRIQKEVSSKVQKEVAQIQKDVGMNKLDTELDKRGLTAEQKNSFLEFASQNPADHGLDSYLKMWDVVTNKSEQQPNSPNPLDSIRQNQSIPQQAGVLQGEKPRKISDDDAMWKGVLGADRVGNKIP